VKITHLKNITSGIFHSSKTNSPGCPASLGQRGEGSGARNQSHHTLQPRRPVRREVATLGGTKGGKPQNPWGKSWEHEKSGHQKSAGKLLFFLMGIIIGISDCKKLWGTLRDT